MDHRIEELIRLIGRLRDPSHTREDLINIKKQLDSISVGLGTCTSFTFTTNTDKLPFGCVVLPNMYDSDIKSFVIEGIDYRIENYDIEIDSKMFDYGLTDEEVVAVMLFNIYHMIKTAHPLQVVREFIDDFLVTNGKVLSIKESMHYLTILRFGIYDAANQATSCLYLPDDIESDAYLESVGIYSFKSAIDKLYHQIPGCHNEATRAPKLSMLHWALRLYDNVSKERIPALHLLEKVKTITASVLYINMFNSITYSLNRIDTEVLGESVTVIHERKRGLLAQLKYNGLRDLESDLYEFRLRAKNAETENDILYALKQINARLAILDDYIRENRHDDPDISRWIYVRDQYIEVRETLAKKKLNKRSYGIFIDYNSLDKLDEE